MEIIRTLNPEDWDDWEPERSSGGGGGGGPKNKEKHQGLKTQNALREELKKARERNTTLFERKRPEQKEDLNTAIDVTINRVFEVDEDVVGIPALREYMLWVYRRLNSNEKPEIEQECKLVFETASGPGGQNVNKVSTAVRIVHLFTCIRFEQEEKRTQEANRADADERMETLIQEHLDKWSEYVVSQTGEMRKIMVSRLREVLAGSVPEIKKESFDGFCRMMGRYPRDHTFQPQKSRLN